MLAKSIKIYLELNPKSIYILYANKQRSLSELSLAIHISSASKNQKLQQLQLVFNRHPMQSGISTERTGFIHEMRIGRLSQQLEYSPYLLVVQVVQYIGKLLGLDDRFRIEFVGAHHWGLEKLLLLLITCTHHDSYEFVFLFSLTKTERIISLFQMTRND